MDRRRIAKWAAALALGGAVGSSARAGAVTFTGHVNNDFPSLGTGIGYVPGVDPSSVAQSPWITQSGWVNGWAIKDLQFNYNQATDTMQVGVAFYSIAGDPSGNPTGSDPRVAAAGGSAPASLGGRDSISVEFAANNATGNGPGAPVIVAGVPQDKSASYTGMDGFTVATAGTSSSIQANYGTQINNAMGSLAFNPSPATPDFEFSIKNWSQFAALEQRQGILGQRLRGLARRRGRGREPHRLDAHPAHARSAGAQPAPAPADPPAPRARAEHRRRLVADGRGRGLGAPTQAAGDGSGLIRATGGPSNHPRARRRSDIPVAAFRYRAAD